MLLYYVRHGDPYYSPNSLTPLGLRQAEAIGRRIAKYPIDEIYSSDSRRAMETAQPLSELLKKEVELLPWANEDRAWDQMAVKKKDGSMTWCFAEESINALFCTEEMLRYGNDWTEHPAIKGTDIEKGYLRIRKEARDFLEKQGFRFNEETGKYDVLEKNEKRIAIFAHHGFGMAFLSNVLNIPYPIFSTRIGLSHSTLQVIHFDSSGDSCTPDLMTHGNDAHLYAENMPTRYENRIYY